MGRPRGGGRRRSSGGARNRRSSGHPAFGSRPRDSFGSGGQHRGRRRGQHHGRCRGRHGDGRNDGPAFDCRRHDGSNRHIQRRWRSARRVGHLVQRVARPAAARPKAASPARSTTARADRRLGRWKGGRDLRAPARCGRRRGCRLERDQSWRPRAAARVARPPGFRVPEPEAGPGCALARCLASAAWGARCESGQARQPRCGPAGGAAPLAGCAVTHRGGVRGAVQELPARQGLPPCRRSGGPTAPRARRPIWLRDMELGDVGLVGAAGMGVALRGTAFVPAIRTMPPTGADR